MRKDILIAMIKVKLKNRLILVGFAETMFPVPKLSIKSIPNMMVLTKQFCFAYWIMDIKGFT